MLTLKSYQILENFEAQIAKINFDKKSLDTLFYFNPIIYSNDKYYWGYAWDIDSLIINNQKEIYSSYTYIERDDDYVMAENQLNLPTLIFSPNKSFYPFIEIEIRDAKYRSLKNIIEFSMNKQLQLQ